MLDSALKEQLRSIFSSLDSKYTLLVEVRAARADKGAEMVELLGEVAETSANIELTQADGEALKLTIVKDSVVSGMSFRAVPNGHEFTSLLLAILNLDGKGKKVAVVGGGNSGVEAAIDLAGICEKVYLYEFMESLKADNVLQDKLRSLPNVEIFTSFQTTKIVGDGAKVVALEAKNRTTEELHLVELDGIFIQIGLSANSSVFKDVVNMNRAGDNKDMKKRVVRSIIVYNFSTIY